MSSNDRVCSCTQLAHFGILFVNTLTQFKVICLCYMQFQDLNPKAPASEEAAIALSVITYIGLIISLLSLTIFVISYLAEEYVT